MYSELLALVRVGRVGMRNDLRVLKGMTRVRSSEMGSLGKFNDEWNSISS